MFYAWWCVFLPPVLMLLYSLWGALFPGKKLYFGPRPLSPERQRFADGLLRRFLWQFALAFAALGFMLMRSTRLMGLDAQRWMAYGFTLLEAVGAAALAVPIERAMAESFDREDEEMTTDNRTVTEQAPAKVNLLLAVGERRQDGYHDLISIMQTVGVCDRVLLRSRDDGEIALRCDSADLAADEDNLCHKAAVKFFSCTGILNRGVSIDLNKVLPMQAGLGGGSADAAAVLRGLRRLYAPELSTEELETMAADLGSDVPFCVRGGTQRVTGRGEHLGEVPRLPECWFVLVKPPLACPTGEMYRRIDELRCYDEGQAQADRMEDALGWGDLAGVCQCMVNTFEKVLPPESPIFAIRRRLLDLGALGAMLSGSGSAVFGVFDREETARMACGILRGDYPQTFCGKSEGNAE